MVKEFRKLLDLSASEINVRKVGNKNLKEILGKVITKCNGDFVFKFLDGNHRDYRVHSQHGDRSNHNHIHGDHSDNSHSDYSEYSKYKDHTDHNDYGEWVHFDNAYSEASYHTDSDGGHSDTKRKRHIDN